MKKSYLNTKNPFAKRILEIIKEYNLINPNNLAMELGMKSNSVLMRTFYVEDRILSGENIQKFLIRFKDLNARWLLIGEGEMRKKNEINHSCSNDVKIRDEKIKELLLRLDDKEQIIKLQEYKIKQLENN